MLKKILIGILKSLDSKRPTLAVVAARAVQEALETIRFQSLLNGPQTIPVTVLVANEVGLRN